MSQFLKLLIGLAIIVAQTLIGARAFFPDAFIQNDNSIVDDIIEEKQSVMGILSPDDLAYLSTHPVIKVGVDPNFYPMEMFDERGRYTGLGGDYMRLIKKMTGLEFRPMARADWAATEESAQKGDIDIFMAAAKTGRRSDYMQFTPPYISMPGIIMTLRGNGPEKADIKSLAGKKVAVTRDYSWHDFLKEFHPEIIPVPADNTLEALRKVTTGEADAILDYEFNLLEKIQTAGILQMQKAGEVDSSYGHAVAVHKNKPELFNIISVALSQITPEEQKILAQKWLNQEKPAGVEKHLQWIFFFFSESVLLCLCLIWYMNTEIKNGVKKGLQAFLKLENVNSGETKTA